MPNPSESTIMKLLLLKMMMTYNYLPKEVISVQPDFKEIS